MAGGQGLLRQGLLLASLLAGAGSSAARSSCTFNDVEYPVPNYLKMDWACDKANFGSTVYWAFDGCSNVGLPIYYTDNGCSAADCSVLGTIQYLYLDPLCSSSWSSFVNHLESSDNQSAYLLSLGQMLEVAWLIGEHMRDPCVGFDHDLDGECINSAATGVTEGTWNSAGAYLPLGLKDWILFAHVDDNDQCNLGEIPGQTAVQQITRNMTLSVFDGNSSNLPAMRERGCTTAPTPAPPPTHAPTGMPTHGPTGMPTPAPSPTPAPPTHAPTVAPPTAVPPTTAPTAVPTHAPTVAPPTAVPPTAAPPPGATAAPTAAPTRAPTAAPTALVEQEATPAPTPDAACASAIIHGGANLASRCALDDGVCATQSAAGDTCGNLVEGILNACASAADFNGGHLVADFDAAEAADMCRDTMAVELLESPLATCQDVAALMQYAATPTASGGGAWCLGGESAVAPCPDVCRALFEAVHSMCAASDAFPPVPSISEPNPPSTAGELAQLGVSQACQPDIAFCVFGTGCVFPTQDPANACAEAINAGAADLAAVCATGNGIFAGILSTCSGSYFTPDVSNSVIKNFLAPDSPYVFFNGGHLAALIDSVQSCGAAVGSALVNHPGTTCADVASLLEYAFTVPSDGGGAWCLGSGACPDECRELLESVHMKCTSGSETFPSVSSITTPAGTVGALLQTTVWAQCQANLATCEYGVGCNEQCDPTQRDMENLTLACVGGAGACGSTVACHNEVQGIVAGCGGRYYTESLVENLTVQAPAECRGTVVNALLLSSGATCQDIAAVMDYAVSSQEDGGAAWCYENETVCPTVCSAIWAELIVRCSADDTITLLDGTTTGVSDLSANIKVSSSCATELKSTLAFFPAQGFNGTDPAGNVYITKLSASIKAGDTSVLLFDDMAFSVGHTFVVYDNVHSESHQVTARGSLLTAVPFANDFSRFSARVALMPTTTTVTTTTATTTTTTTLLSIAVQLPSIASVSSEEPFIEANTMIIIAGVSGGVCLLCVGLGVMFLARRRSTGEAIRKQESALQEFHHGAVAVAGRNARQVRWVWDMDGVDINNPNGRHPDGFFA